MKLASTGYTRDLSLCVWVCESASVLLFCFDECCGFSLNPLNRVQSWCPNCQQLTSSHCFQCNMCQNSQFHSQKFIHCKNGFLTNENLSEKGKCIECFSIQHYDKTAINISMFLLIPSWLFKLGHIEKTCDFAITCTTCDKWNLTISPKPHYFCKTE